MASTRLLFVDDEDSIRLTLPPLLQKKGYEVSVAASVKEALEKINAQQFDILLADLNIGGPGDGFTLVGAMRRMQPNAVNIIITGYPDFESALDAIRQQVDGYVIKPANIDELVRHIEERRTNRTPPRNPLPAKSVAQIVAEGKQQIIDKWLGMVREHAELSKLRLTDDERIDHLSDVLTAMAEMLRSPEASLSADEIDAAKKHGESRRRQGYKVPMMVEETRLLERSIFSLLHANLLSADFSSLIPDIIRISDTLQVQLKASLEAHSALRKKAS